MVTNALFATFFNFTGKISILVNRSRLKEFRQFVRNDSILGGNFWQASKSKTKVAIRR